MATFCQIFKMTPAEYRALTMGEMLAFIQVRNNIGTTERLEDLLDG